MKILIFLFSFGFIIAQSMPFRVHETLTYKAFFSGVPAGLGELTVIKLDTIQDLPSYHVRFKAWTTGFSDKLFSINDKIDIWLDAKSLETIKVENRIQEGNYKKNSMSLFYHNDELVVIDGDTLSIPQGSQSPYSLLYSLRQESIPDLHDSKLLTVAGGKITQLKFLTSSKQKVTVPYGDFVCNRVTPIRTDKKQFKNKGEISIWFSEEKPAQIPVKIWIKLKFGTLILELVNRIN
jgi:hypothetical protein